MTSDLDLLRQFTRENSQEAFATLVQRHLNLVYSAALRQVRSPQLAEEIAQSVFADLARNARKLKPGTLLTAWLYAVTCRTAIDVIRKESRRRLREQIAVEMNNVNATATEWAQIAPLLDDAMAALDETDRSAVLLRYFENKSLREVGEALGTSEDAAQKRVSRAVERLRAFFSKRNVTVGTSGLIVLISANAVQSAPVGLVTAISAAAVLTGTTVSTSTAIAATKTIVMTALQKTIISAVLIAAVGTGVYEAHQAARLHEQNQALRRQQTALVKHIRQLQRERDDATNQLTGLLAANAQLQSGSNEAELLKLRNITTQLMENSRKLGKENDELEKKISRLEGLWYNVTNAPQYAGPYLTRDQWSLKGFSGPLHTLLSAATAATEGDEAEIAELTSNTNSRSLFSKRRWDNVKGIQIISVDGINGAGIEMRAVVNTLIMKQAGGATDPHQPAALKDAMHSYTTMRRWYLTKTRNGWKITGSD